MTRTVDQQLTALSGNEAVAYAYKQARPHVAPAFPITQQTRMIPQQGEIPFCRCRGISGDRGVRH